MASHEGFITRKKLKHSNTAKCISQIFNLFNFNFSSQFLFTIKPYNHIINYCIHSINLAWYFPEIMLKSAAEPGKKSVLMLFIEKDRILK